MIINDDLISSSVNDTKLVCGGRGLGKLWMAAAYNPLKGRFFVPLAGSCRTISVAPADMQEGGAIGMETTGDIRFSPGETSAGRIYAADARSGRNALIWKQPTIITASFLATAGGLLFAGDSAGMFMALDQDSGKVLQSIRLNTTIGGSPITYSVNGKQYVAIVTGPNTQTSAAARLAGNKDPVTEGGNSVFVLGL